MCREPSRDAYNVPQPEGGWSPRKGDKNCGQGLDVALGHFKNSKVKAKFHVSP